MCRALARAPQKEKLLGTMELGKVLCESPAVCGVHSTGSNTHTVIQPHILVLHTSRYEAIRMVSKVY